MPDLQAFLKDLYELSIRHGFMIEGCGHCSAPLILDQNGDVVATELSFDISEEEYTVKKQELICQIELGSNGEEPSI